MQINEEKLNQLMGQAIVDMGAAVNAPLIVIGDKLGLYKIIAEAGPMNTAELAERSGSRERYIREWIRAQAASGYVTYHRENDTYSLTAEQHMMFAMEDSPVFLVGGFQCALAAAKIADRLEEDFKSGKGISWQEQDHDLFHGTERFF